MTQEARRLCDIAQDEAPDDFTLERDGERPIRFKGWCLGTACSQFNTAHPDYSGSTGRRAILTLYKTTGGNYVAEREELTQWQGEHDRHHAKLCKTVDELVDFLGHGRVAKELYQRCAIDTAETVE